MHFVLLCISLTTGIVIFAATVSMLRPVFAAAPKAVAERSCRRFRVYSICEVSWQDAEGNTATARATLRNVSEEGALLKLRRPLREDTFLVIRLPEYHLGGSAWVLRCKPDGRSYALGIRFNGPLTRTV